MKQNFRKSVQAQFAIGYSMLAAVGLITFGVPVASAGVKPSIQGSITGVVRDSGGTPQIGIVVELLRADSTMVSRAFTDQRGTYLIVSVLPGQYALRAEGSSFIPVIKQNLRVRASTIVNVTLSTLYDLMQWAPEPQRVKAQSENDWAWTLRSAASRPLLRWQDDGSPVLISDGSNETSAVAQTESRRRAEKRRVRVLASGGGKQFGSGPQQLSYAMLDNASSRRRVAVGVDLGSPAAGLGSAGMMQGVLGFRQEMASSGMGASSMQTLAAMMSDPDVGSGSAEGLQALSVRSWESLQLLNSLEAEAGSDQVVARLGDGSTVAAALPFASLTIHHGKSALEYRVATARNNRPDADEATAAHWLPILSEQRGNLVLEHGMHQELGWSTSAGPAEMQVVIFADTIENPMIEGSGRLSADDESGQWVLLDRASGQFRTAGPNFSTTGMLASVESRLPGNNRVKLSYASGDALVMHTNQQPQDVAMILRGVGTRRTQMYSLMLSGTAEGIGTQWRASYRWQPGDTVTEVAPFAVDASEPYLNLYVRQPIWTRRDSDGRQGTAGVEAQVDVRNLLAEGYQPFVSSDGSHLYFAQAQRCVRGGVAFNF